MSSEKKLGLAFLGILVVAFCGVLTMRLMGDRSAGDKVEVNVGGPVAATPTANPSGSSLAAKAGSGAPADRGPPPTSTLERPDASRAIGNNATAARTPVAPPAYLPPPSAMRPANESITPPPSTGLAARTPSPANDPFSRGPAPSAGLAPAGGTPPAPPAMAMTPSPYGGNPPAAGTLSPPAGGNAQPPAVASAAMTAPAEPPSATLSPAAGNPLRGSAPPSELRTPGVAALAGPSAGAGISSASPSATVTEPTLPTGRESVGAPTGRTDSAVTFSPPTGSPARIAPVGGVASPLSGSPPGGLASTGGAARPESNRDIAVTSAAIPAATQDKPYVVAPDDSFWSISEKAYGNGAYYRALFQYNRDRYPNAEDIRPGSVLDVPPLEVLQRQFPELTTNSAAEAPAELAPPPAPAVPPATYVVREGDTLFEVARKQLGKASRWAEIYELNRAVLGENLENLRPGVELRLK